MTWQHLTGIGLAVLCVLVSLHTSHATEGIAFATSLATGLLGHAQGARGAMKRQADARGGGESSSRCPCARDGAGTSPDATPEATPTKEATP